MHGWLWVMMDGMMRWMVDGWWMDVSDEMDGWWVVSDGWMVGHGRWMDDVSDGWMDDGWMNGGECHV